MILEQQIILICIFLMVLQQIILVHLTQIKDREEIIFKLYSCSYNTTNHFSALDTN
jgi:hypothetical protein